MLATSGVTMTGCQIQWTPSNPATLRTSQSVLIRGVVSVQGLDVTILKHTYFRTFYMRKVNALEWSPAGSFTLRKGQISLHNQLVLTLE